MISTWTLIAILSIVFAIPSLIYGFIEIQGDGSPSRKKPKGVGFALFGVVLILVSILCFVISRTPGVDTQLNLPTVNVAPAH